MATWIKIEVTDSVDRRSSMRFRVTPGHTTAEYTTFFTNLASFLFGVGLPSIGGWFKASVEIDLDTVGHAPYGFCDTRDNWQMSWVPGDGDAFRMGIPCRDLDPALLATGSKTLADLTQSAWSNLVDALSGGTIVLLDPEDGDVATEPLEAIANVRARKRPREGAKR
jgi:hypothetical protein